MKVPGSRFVDDKDNNKVKYKYALFGRCVKIEIATSRSGGNKALTIEYNPGYSNEEEIEKAKANLKGGDELALKVVQQGTLCAKIEGSVVELPKANNKNHTPGFNAVLKIYNDFGGVITSVLDTRNKYITDFANKDANETTKRAALQRYLENKYWAVVWVGYWNEEKKAADYTKIFVGAINSWYSYRKGAELITEMQCANVYPEKTHTQQLNLMFGAGQNATKLISDEEEKTETPFVMDVEKGSWYDLACLAIQQLSTRRTPKIDNPKNQTPVPIMVSDDDRKKTSWFEVKSDDYGLSTMMFRGADDPRIKNFYSPRRDFDYVWADVLSVFPGAKVTYKKEDDYARGVTVYKIIPLGNGQKQGKKLPGVKHYIYDYQNLLDSPMMSPTGGLTINMLLRPEIKAWDWIELQLTSNNQYGKSVGFNGTAAYEAPYLMGSKSQIVAGTAGAKGVLSQYKNGSVFNKPFLIYKVIHTFSTHSNTWKTSVTTTPLIYGTGTGN